MIKVLENVELKETYFNKINSICEKPTVKIILNEANLAAISLKSGMRQSYPLSHPHFILILSSMH